MRCPVCNKLEYGQVGNGQYYCWNCCLEFHGQPGNWRFFSVDEEGGLVELAGLPEGETPSADREPRLVGTPLR